MREAVIASSVRTAVGKAPRGMFRNTRPDDLLVHALKSVLAQAPGALVACLSAQDFLDELVQAMERDRVDAWRSRYRRATAFLLDDIHLLAQKQRSQEELFHLFNALIDTQRQLVFTANVPPRELGIDDRLISRLEGGLVAEIQPPDRDLRLAVVTRELRSRLGKVDPDLAAYLADRPATSLRTVTGAVQRVVGDAELQGAPPGMAQARALLEGAAEPARHAVPRLRTSGVVVSPSGGVRSREKVIWRWPNISDRILEDVG